VSAERRVLVGVHGFVGQPAGAAVRDRRGPQAGTPGWSRSSPGCHPAATWPSGASPCTRCAISGREAAVERLEVAFDQGLGGLPAGLVIEPLVIRGPAGPVLVDHADRPDDLLVVGTGRRGGLRRLRRSVGRYCLAKARLPGDRGGRPRTCWKRPAAACTCGRARTARPPLGHPDAWLRRTSSS